MSGVKGEGREEEGGPGVSFVAGDRENLGPEQEEDWGKEVSDLETKVGE
jgi:hypothetical protein